MYHPHDEKELNWEPGGVRSGAGVRRSGLSQESSGSSETWGSALPAALEAVAVAVHLQDVDVVGEAVQQRAGEAFRPEDRSPCVEGQIGGHQHRSPLVALG